VGSKNRFGICTENRLLRNACFYKKIGLGLEKMYLSLKFWMSLEKSDEQSQKEFLQV
jgi:hypothetical protein